MKDIMTPSGSQGTSQTDHTEHSRLPSCLKQTILSIHSLLHVSDPEILLLYQTFRVTGWQC